MKPAYLLLTGIFCGMALSGCALLKGDKKPVKLELRPAENAVVNYGSVFDLECYLIYDNKKEKEITGKDELAMTVIGATYRNGRISIENYPKTLSDNSITVKGTYQKDEITLTDELEIPYNYKSEIILNFNGPVGKHGADGGKGGTALIFRDGKEGDPGYDGGSGGEGSNLTVYVWKDSIDFYFIRVVDMTASQQYIYKIKDTGMRFSIQSIGGTGGNGGNGGEGGSGKDGSESDGKQKAPGDGGRGGNGGRAGDGGKGGDVYVFIHPNATDLQDQLVVFNPGGSAGKYGEGGKGGKAGTPLTGQTAGTDGSAGTSGSLGFSGSSGVKQILIEEFDFPY